MLDFDLLIWVIGAWFLVNLAIGGWLLVRPPRHLGERLVAKAAKARGPSSEARAPTGV